MPISVHELYDPNARGFLPVRPPMAALTGQWAQLDLLAQLGARTSSQHEVHDAVGQAEQEGIFWGLRQRASRLAPRNAAAVSMRIGVIVAACGWPAMDPISPAARATVPPDFLDLWTTISSRLAQPRFTGLANLALLNWAPERKPRTSAEAEQAARKAALVPVIRFSEPDEELNRLDLLMLSAVRLEANSVWLFHLAQTLSTHAPASETSVSAIQRLTVVQNSLLAQVRRAQLRLSSAPIATAQQRRLIGILAQVPGGLLVPPTLFLLESMLGISTTKPGKRALQRRALPDSFRAPLASLDRQCSGLRGLSQLGGPAGAAARNAQTALITLQRAWSGLTLLAASSSLGASASHGWGAGAAGLPPLVVGRPGSPTLAEESPPAADRTGPGPVGVSPSTAGRPGWWRPRRYRSAADSRRCRQACVRRRPDPTATRASRYPCHGPQVLG